MKDCMNCINHSKDGCKVWKCDFKSIEDYKNEFAISVLEKIKEEIENMWIKSSKDLRTGEVIYENLCEHSEVLEIINKYISELKGE